MRQIAAGHEQGEALISSHIRRATLIFVVAVMLSFAANVYIQWKSAVRSNQPAPAVVGLRLAMEEANPMLCPGDVLPYTLTILIDEPTVVDTDSVVRNLDTLRTEVFSNTQRDIFDQVGAVDLHTAWIVPSTLPATPTRPERLWTVGNYRRNIALTGAEGDSRAAVVSVDFQIGAECPGVLR